MSIWNEFLKDNPALVEALREWLRNLLFAIPYQMMLLVSPISWEAKILTLVNNLWMIFWSAIDKYLHQQAKGEKGWTGEADGLLSAVTLGKVKI